MSINSRYQYHIAALRMSNEKLEGRSEQTISGQVDFFMRAYHAVQGRELSPHTSVLDFGCGIGNVVTCLNKRGMNAYGIDILEYWGEDAVMCGRKQAPPPLKIVSRLNTYTPENKIPFADGTFDVIISDQVIEHVFDLRNAFSEQMRVLKNKGIAIHRFPQSHALIEPHTKLPFTALNKYSSYLFLMAFLGLRGCCQDGMSWREALASYRHAFLTTNYLSKKAMLAEAKQVAGCDAEFIDYIPISGSRLGVLYHNLTRFKVGAIVKPLLSIISMNHVLVLRKNR